jgi:hypothetical protein
MIIVSRQNRFREEPSCHHGWWLIFGKWSKREGGRRYKHREQEKYHSF